MMCKKNPLVAVLLFAFQFLSGLGIAQNATPLFWLKEEPFFADEFLYAYNKNRQVASLNDAGNPFEDYFELYVRFRLKVKEAKTLGYHENPSFISEMAGYKKQLAKPYLSENLINEELVNEAYERTLEEVEASHILLSVPAQASPNDTLAAFNQLLAIRQKVAAGESFAELARQFSQDPSVDQNGGYLGFFAAFQMVYPFEDAAFKTPVGQVSQPFSTAYGYHVVMVHSRRKAEGSVRLAHIFFRHDNTDTLLAKQKAIQVNRRLEQGGDWDALAAQYSEEESNKRQGGELPWLTFRQLPPSFYGAAVALSMPGQVAGPVKTESGWHLLKMLERKAVPPLDEVRTMIESRIARDGRAASKSVQSIESLVDKLGVIVDQAALRAAMASIDGRVLDGSWTYAAGAATLTTLLAKGENELLFAEDFYRFVELNQRRRADISHLKYIDMLWNQYFLEWLEEIELKQLYLSNENYRFLYNEYYDGTLLFELMNERVWQAASSDTTGLNSFFDGNRHSYSWDERAAATIFEGKGEVIERVLASSIDSLYLLDKEEVSSETNLPSVIEAKLSSFRSEGIAIDSTIVLVTGSSDFISKAADKASVYGHVLVKLELVDSQPTLEWLTSSKSTVEKHFNSSDPLSLTISSGIFEKKEGIIPEIYWRTGRHLSKSDKASTAYLITKIIPAKPKEISEIRGRVISDYQQFLDDTLIRSLKEKYTLKVNKHEWKNLSKSLNEK